MNGFWSEVNNMWFCGRLTLIFNKVFEGGYQQVSSRLKVLFLKTRIIHEIDILARCFDLG